MRLAERTPVPVMALAYGVLLTLCRVLAPPTTKAFIYFQF